MAPARIGATRREAAEDLPATEVRQDSGDLRPPKGTARRRTAPTPGTAGPPRGAREVLRWRR
ncbi:hypothetical protein Airi02_035850 [Actinoallomurus iriomotensis]|uniref:Uncharacterized protein n=1 Tax=Actinoallomurus iriomotensis TaxID=478107 RepID=A0A9W6W168_9ACTN|nr:hypothetical protein Airi02_035850 [Actinoallomurus iriomotensis]